MTTMSKIFEMFKNLKPDAKPRPPRPYKESKNESQEVNDENVNSSNEPEEILVESDDDATSEEMPKFKKSFFKPGKRNGKSKKSDKHSNSTVNTQATGNVINVVNSKNVRWGNDYYMGPTYMGPAPPHHKDNDEETYAEEKNVKKCNDIKLLMEVTIKPEIEYIYVVANNLGKTWHKFFIRLGYSKKRIETFEIDNAKYGVIEARVKLLLDWINNEDDATLGHLATLLWEEGERQIVKELALLYRSNKK